MTSQLLSIDSAIRPERRRITGLKILIGFMRFNFDNSNFRWLLEESQTFLAIPRV
jgi:hypothetical protein